MRFRCQRRTPVQLPMSDPTCRHGWRCRAEGIPAAEIRVAPQPVTPELLLTSERLDRGTAEAIVAALAAGGLLDEASRAVHRLLAWGLAGAARAGWSRRRLVCRLLTATGRLTRCLLHTLFAVHTGRVPAARPTGGAGGMAGGTAARAGRSRHRGGRQRCGAGAGRCVQGCCCCGWATLRLRPLLCSSATGPCQLPMPLPHAACACAQLLNVAYAQHELTGGSTGAALAWLEAGGAASIEGLLQQSAGQQEQL